MSYDKNLEALQRMRQQVETLASFVNAKEKNIAMKESQIKQGQVFVEDARDLERNMAKNLGPLAPGNLGDINKVIWPFFFSTDLPQTAIGPNETFQTGFSVTQEAAFIMMSFTQTVYRDTGTQWVYLDPNDSAGTYSQAPGLTFTLRDGSSSRQFFNTPMNISNYGNPRFPTKFPRPIMLLPNQVMQVAFQNQSQGTNYVPFITAFGYRIRIEDAQNFLSLVYG